MPEGHTIHRLARDHLGLFRGSVMELSSPQGRFSAGAALLDGLVLSGTDAWGKHLFYSFAGEQLLHIHLGLYGKFWPFEAPAPAETHRQVRLRMLGASHGVDLTGPITCEVIEEHERQALVARLGPDPIRRDADPERAWRALQRRRGPIGVALMDQTVIAGIGNVYRAEALFAHGMHPLRPANSLAKEEWEALWATLVAFLRQGVKDARIVTMDPKEICKPRSRITRAEATYAYKQETCRRCAAPIRRWDLAGRWAYACETCQPL